jgi:hypothetical protein
MSFGFWDVEMFVCLFPYSLSPPYSISYLKFSLAKINFLLYLIRSGVFFPPVLVFDEKSSDIKLRKFKFYWMIVLSFPQISFGAPFLLTLEFFLQESCTEMKLQYLGFLNNCNI